MRFEVLLGPEDGVEKSIRKDTITIGRGAHDDISFPYAGMVSREHAKVSKEQKNYYLVDQGSDGKGSKNGTVILTKEGKRIEIRKEETGHPRPGDKVDLSPGDILILGRSMWLKFLGD